MSAAGAPRGAGRFRVHLVDGTYELFRHFFAVPRDLNAAGDEVGAVRGVLSSILWMFEDGATHLGVATDKVIESFRNGLWPGYKTGEGVEPALMTQFPLLEDSLAAMGVAVWAMVELEADDALASAAALATADERVEQVLICTPDKDLSQCVQGDRVVQFDRRQRQMRDESGVVEKFGVPPRLIPDYLALVGDSSDGFPGLNGWGPKSASTVLTAHGGLDAIPDDVASWEVTPRGAERLASTLREHRDDAALFKRLATLRVDEPLFADIDEIRWAGPRSDFADVCEHLDAPELAARAAAAAANR